MTTTLRFILILCASGYAVAQGAAYRMALVGGQVYPCKAKYQRSNDGMVRFTLLSGSVIGVHQDQVDWHETARLNGEPVPSWAKKQKQEVDIIPDLKLPRLDFSWNRVRHDIRKLKRAPGFGTLKGMSLLTYGAGLGCFLILCLVTALMLYQMMHFFGEPNRLIAVYGWNCLLMLGAIVAAFITRYSPFDLVITMLLMFFVVYLVWTSVIIKAFDCELNNAFLIIIIYEALFGLTLWVLYQTSEFFGILK